MRTLDLNEAAHFLRLHPHTLEAKARAGEVPGAKPGKCWVFLDIDLAEWLRAQCRSEKQEKQPCRSTGAAPSIGVSEDSCGNAEDMGWLMGLEPTTTGITILPRKKKVA